MSGPVPVRSAAQWWRWPVPLGLLDTPARLAVQEVARATPVSIGRLPGETSCLTLVWAVLDRASPAWRGLTMTADGLRLQQDLRRSLLDPPPATAPPRPA